MLAAQKPAWPPGTRHGYHAITLGWYESELIRRTDPAGRTLGRFLADEVAGPLGLDLLYRTAGFGGRATVSRICTAGRARKPCLHLNAMPPRLRWPRHLIRVGLTRPCVRLPSDVDAMAGDYNRDDIRAIEIPSANGIGTAGAVASLRLPPRPADARSA